jgi:hypothetical protein
MFRRGLWWTPYPLELANLNQDAGMGEEFLWSD